MTAPVVRRVTPADSDYRGLEVALTAEPLTTQWWDDAESRWEDGVSYWVAYAPDKAGTPVPAAWAGWIIEGGLLRCCNNYVRHGFRRCTPELYELAYRARHRRVVARLGLPAVTYLYPEPIGLHLAHGWIRDTGPGSAGTSRARPDGPEHRWQRLLWIPASR